MWTIVKNITLALDERIIAAGREYAKKHNMTLNGLVRRLLEQTVTRQSQKWIEESFSLMDRAKVARDAPRKWKRDELYRV